MRLKLSLLLMLHMKYRSPDGHCQTYDLIYDLQLVQ